jgi:hypothetical protein
LRGEGSVLRSKGSGKQRSVLEITEEPAHGVAEF